jgi:Flp pilus assembly protein TadD
VKRFPRLFVAHYFAGIAARAHGDYQSAEKEFRSALTIEPRNVNALAQLGFVLLERGDIRMAEITLRNAVKINDKHFYANYDLGRLLVKAGRYEGALPVLKHAVSLKQTNPSVHYQLFLALTRLKRKDEAQQEFEVFKQLDEARKARPRTELDLEDEDLLNPSPP